MASPSPERVRSLISHRTAIAEARSFVRERAADCCLPETFTEDLVLAVSEACGNAFAHTDSLVVRVSWRVEGQDIEVQVRDDGVFERDFMVPQFDDEGAGFGIRLMMSLVDEFAIRRGTPDHPGTIVRLRKCLGEDVVPEIFVLSEAATA